MKITNNSSTTTSALMARYIRSNLSPSSSKNTFAPIMRQENLDYLQQVSTKNRHAQGLLRQLLDLLTQTIHNPSKDMFKESIEQNISKLYKKYPQHATRLKNQEFSTQELIQELEKITDEIQEESQNFQSRIFQHLIADQNTQANKKQDISKLTKALVSKRTVNIIEISAVQTNNLLK